MCNRRFGTKNIWRRNNIWRKEVTAWNYKSNSRLQHLTVSKEVFKKYIEEVIGSLSRNTKCTTLRTFLHDAKCFFQLVILKKRL